MTNMNVYTEASATQQALFDETMQQHGQTYPH